MKALTVLILAIALITLISLIPGTELFAQPGFPDGPSQAPIDGGLGLLAAGGAAYAVKKLRERKSEE